MLLAQTNDPLPGERRSVIEPLIAKVTASIEAERWLDAVLAFDQGWQLLHENEDLLTVGGHVGAGVLEFGENRTQAGARNQLRSIARSAPAAFRVAYAEQFDAVALAALQKAIRSGHRSQLISLHRRYEHTPSGSSVLRFLAADARAHGDSTNLALLLKQLLDESHGSEPELQLTLATAWSEAGFSSEARQTVRELAENEGYGKSLTVAGRVWKLPKSEAEVAEWTDRLEPRSAQHPDNLWLNSIGSASGWRTHAQQPPQLKVGWRQSLFQSASHPEFATVLERLEDFTLPALQNAPVGPAQPLVTESLVIVQSVGTIRAFDRQTGQLVWESDRFNRQLKTALSTILESSQESQRFFVAAQIIANAPQNHVRGQMTSDGNLLFCIEETSQGIDSPVLSAAFTAGNQSFNILRVYDVATGRLRGQIGGLSATPAGHHSESLSAVYFLGAPLLLNGRILILAEDSQGIHLLDLQPTSGLGNSSGELNFRIANRQLLLVPTYKLQSHPLRRFAGITPAFGNGLIVCHGCDEHVVAVDASDLSLRWINRYRGNVNPKQLGNGDPVLGSALTDDDSRRRDRTQRPHDSTARVVGDHIILMPRDSDHVVCFDLNTGTQLWSRPRNQLKYVAGFTDKTVVLAGSSQLVSIRRTDGKQVWQHILSNAGIAGQPAATDRLIYVPTEEGQLITLSLATGRQLLRQQLADSRLGNLTSINGQLLSQTNRSITSWLAGDTVRPDSLVSIEKALLSEDIHSAVDQLTQLIESTSADQRQPLRQLLADQLFESLRIDFGANRHFVSKLQTLIDESSVPISQITDALHRSMGMTLLDATELPAQWIDLEAPLAMQDRMEQLVIQGLMTQQDLSSQELVTQISGAIRGSLRQPERDQRVGRVRRLSANHTATVIHRVLQRQDETTRKNIIASLQPVVQQIIDRTLDENLALHQAQFCWMAGLARCLKRGQVFDRLPESNRRPFFHTLLASGSSGFAPTAADFSGLWKSGDLSFFGHLLESSDWQNGPFNDWVGRISDQLQIQYPVQRLSNPGIEVGDARTARATPNPTIGSVRKVIPLYGTPGIFRGWQFVRTQGDRGILAIDAAGRRRWTFDDFAFNDSTGKREILRPNQQNLQPDYCVAMGQMLAVVEDGNLIMLDGAVDKTATPRVIWRIDLTSILPNSTQHQRTARAWERTQIYDRQPDGLGPLGPITEFGVPLFRGHRLVVLNPWTGSVMWFEEGLPDDSRLIAHSSRLCLLSAATGQVQVRDMRDGSVIHSDELPVWWEQANLNYDTSVRQVDLEKGTIVPWRVAIEGTRCLIFSLTPGRASLQCFDLSETEPDAEGLKQVWQTPLSENSVYSNVSGGLVAVLQDDNHLQIRQVYDGRILVDQQVTPAKSCERLYLRKSGGRIIVLTHCMSSYETPFPAIGTVPVNGPIYAFEAFTGKPAWSSASNNQSIRILNPDNAPMLPSVPLLILVRNNFPQVSPGNPIRRFVSAQILDVRDGRVLYEEEDVGRTLSYHAMRFDDDDRITVSFDKRSIVFDFTPSKSDP